ncbi:MAG: DUF4337 domain-containing protein [Hyphomicrobiaceae bacterium]
MGWNEMALDAEKENKASRDRLISVYIGIVAVILAICAMGGGNATKDSTRYNIEATNGWNFFQAKNLRRNALLLSVDELELTLKANPQLSAEARALYEEKIKARKADIARLSNDPATKEGLDQLFERNKGLEKQRDESLRRDPYFDYGQAFLQIAIVIASVALISSGSLLLVFSAVCAALGAFCTLNGFTMLFSVPFIG